MVFLCVLLALPIVLLVLIFLSDCDFSLKFYERFGASPKSQFYGRVVWITGASSGIGENLAYELARCGCKLVLSARRKEELERVKKKCGATLKSQFYGRLVWITGPSSGIGEYLSYELARSGCKLVLSARRKDIVKKKCGEIAQPFYSSYNVDQDVLVLPMDVTEFAKHDELTVTVLNHFQQIDILVNNSGRSQRGMVIDTPGLEVEQAMLELNTLAVISLTKAVLPHMVKRKTGHIVVTSSVAGKIGAPMSAVYCATKFALQGYFNSLRIEIYNSNINVTMVCPGPILTNIRANAFTEDVNVQVKDKTQPPSNDRRMDAAKCAHLIAVGMANKLDELWISPNPILFFLYASQYLPSVFGWVAKRLGIKHIQKMREMSDVKPKEKTT